MIKKAVWFNDIVLARLVEKGLFFVKLGSLADLDHFARAIAALLTKK